MTKKLVSIVAALLLAALLNVSPARATQTENRGIRVLPAPGKVVIDGKYDDWDLSGGVFACDDVEHLRDKFSVWIYTMADADNLYVLARWKDPTPLNNPGSYPGGFGFNGDCLQLRFILFPNTPNQGVTWWTCWQDKNGNGVVDEEWPDKVNDITSPRGPSYANALGSGPRQAFRVNPDGKGYTQEIAIPWKMLSVSGQPLKVGDQFRMTAEPNFTAGEFGRITIKDIFSDQSPKPDRVFTFRSYRDWGTATLVARGHVAPQPVRLADERTFPVSMAAGAPVVDWAGIEKTFSWPGFKPITFDMPFDGYASLNLYGADGVVARQLLTWNKFAAGKHIVMWDGLTTPTYRTPGDPVAPGAYTWKAIVQPGVKLTLRGYADYGGKAPWESRPDTFWGGDHGTPSAVVTDGVRMYMAWNGAEGGRHVQATDLTGKFLWGLQNTTGSGDPDVIAVDNGTVYILNRPYPGQSQIFSRADAATGTYQPWTGTKSHILQVHDIWKNPDGMPTLIVGLDAKNGKLYAVGGDKLAVLDGGDGKEIKTLPMPGATFVRAVSDSLVYVIANANTILAVDPETGTSKALVSGLSNAKCLNVDSDGNLYVSLWEPAMQVAEFTPSGKAAGTFGRSGGRQPIGPWQADGMYNPYGVAIDKEGKLWVMERDFFPKRVSVWNLQSGKLIKDFFGPTHYGASGGAILPSDPNIMIGEGCEWRIDPVNGGHICTGVIDRTLHSYATFRKGANGAWYLFTTIGQYGDATVRIFQRLGEGKYALRAELRPTSIGRTPTGTTVWTDANGDGIEQPGELQQYPDWLLCAGSNSWSLNIGLDMTLYGLDSNTQTWKELKLAGLSACGAPTYNLSAMHDLPAVIAEGCQPNYTCAIPDASGKHLLVNASVGHQYLWRCFDIASGKLLWSYPDTWFQVGDSHSAPAPEPGLFRGAYGPVGIAKLPVAGTVWAINGNLGEWGLLTGDGFYLTRLFNGDPFEWVWPDTGAPGGDLTNCPPGSGGEDFGGSMTQGDDGRMYIQAGKLAVWNVGVENLDKLEAINGPGKVTITGADVQTATALRDKALQLSVGEHTYTIDHLTVPFTSNINADFAGADFLEYEKSDETHVRNVMAYDDTNLYVGWDVRDTSPWVNGAGDYSQIYVGGDTVNLQLGTDASANPARGNAVKGDLRLAIGPIQGVTTAVLYKFVSPDKQPRVFSSGVVKSYTVDYVGVLQDAKVTVQVHRGQGYVVEAAIPWSELGVTPHSGLTLRGDLGVTYGDETGQRTRLRNYWSNQVTGLVDDVVLELKPTPANWGDFTLR